MRRVEPNSSYILQREIINAIDGLERNNFSYWAKDGREKINSDVERMQNLICSDGRNFWPRNSPQNLPLNSDLFKLIKFVPGSSRRKFYLIEYIAE